MGPNPRLSCAETRPTAEHYRRFRHSSGPEWPENWPGGAGRRMMPVQIGSKSRKPPPMGPNPRLSCAETRPSGEHYRNLALPGNVALESAYSVTCTCTFPAPRHAHSKSGQHFRTSFGCGLVARWPDRQTRKWCSAPLKSPHSIRSCGALTALPPQAISWQEMLGMAGVCVFTVP
jgi:hypothetical protein